MAWAKHSCASSDIRMRFAFSIASRASFIAPAKMRSVIDLPDTNAARSMNSRICAVVRTSRRFCAAGSGFVRLPGFLTVEGADVRWLVDF